MIGRLSGRPIFIVLGALVAGLTIFGQGFWNPANLQNLATAVSIQGIMVVGMTIVMIGRGFDLSIGSVMALAGVLVIDLQPLGIFIATVLALSAATLAGLGNGLLITRLRINPFIATFATMVMVRGLVMSMTGGQPSVGLDFDFMVLGRGRVFGIPVSSVILAITMVMGYLLLSRARLGRHIYALGGDEKAARINGIPTDRVKVISYGLCGLSAGIAGVVLASRLNTGSPIIGSNIALGVIAAVLLGGVSLSGGVGTIIGSLAGLLTIGVLGNGLNLFNVPAYYQHIAQGVLLIGLVIIDRWPMLQLSRISRAQAP
jgi:ribose/xylose/arabinose/galactoside ABC-type transport system permease subunit